MKAIEKVLEDTIEDFMSYFAPEGGISQVPLGPFERAREALAALKTDVCQTCGGNEEVLGRLGFCDKKMVPCPACQPEDELIRKIQLALCDPKAPWYGSDLVSWVGDLIDRFTYLPEDKFVKRLRDNLAQEENLTDSLFSKLLKEDVREALARITSLRQEKSEAVATRVEAENECCVLRGEVKRLEAEKAGLEAILKPFAEFSTLVDITRNETTITLQDFMKARQALKKGEAKEKDNGN